MTCRGAGLGGGTFWGWGCDDGEEQQAAVLQARTHWEKGGASRRPRGRICRMPEHAAVQERSCPPPWPQQDSTRAGGRVCWHMSKNHKQHIPTQHTQTIHMIKPKKQFITKNHKHGKSRPSGSGVLSTLRVLCGRGVAYVVASRLSAVPRANCKLLATCGSRCTRAQVEPQPPVIS